MHANWFVVFFPLNGQDEKRHMKTHLLFASQVLLVTALEKKGEQRTSTSSPPTTEIYRLYPPNQAHATLQPR